MEILLSNVYVIGIVVGLIGAISDSFLNQYANRGGLGWLLAGYAGWIATATVFIFLLREETFGKAVILFLLSNIIFALFIGKIIFAEQLSMLQWVGVLIGIVAIILITRNH